MSGEKKPQLTREHLLRMSPEEVRNALAEGLFDDLLSGKGAEPRPASSLAHLSPEEIWQKTRDGEFDDLLRRTT